MLAELSEMMQDIMDLWPLWAAIGTALAGAVAWALKTWLKVNVADPIAGMRAEQSATHHLVKYHLGPNGESPRMHDRVHAVEQALGIDTPAPRRYPEPWDDSNDG
jgi:hypothetical protein